MLSSDKTTCIHDEIAVHVLTFSFGIVFWILMPGIRHSFFVGGDVYAASVY